MSLLRLYTTKTDTAKAAVQLAAKKLGQGYVAVIHHTERGGWFVVGAETVKAEQMYRNPHCELVGVYKSCTSLRAYVIEDLNHVPTS